MSFTSDKMSFRGSFKAEKAISNNNPNNDIINELQNAKELQPMGESKVVNEKFVVIDQLDQFKEFHNWEYSQDLLYNLMDKKSLLFLTICGMNFDSSSFNPIYHPWKIILFSLLLFALVAVFLVDIFNSNIYAGLILPPCLLQFIGFIIAAQQGRNKMISVPMKFELHFYPEVIRTSIIIFVLCLATEIGIVSIYIRQGEDVSRRLVIVDSLLCLAGFTQSLLIAGSLVFLLVDVRVSCALIDYLSIQLQKNNLTSSLYLRTIADINTRISLSSWNNNCMMIIALIDLLFLFVYAICFPIEDMIFPIALLLKQLMWVIVGYTSTARVHEKADHLIEEISQVPIYSSDDIEKRLAMNDLYRFAHGKPITFSLAGMRVKSQDVAIRVGVWILAFVIALLKEEIWNLDL